MNNTGSAKHRVSDKGARERFWLASSRSDKKTRPEKTTKIDTSVVSDLSSWDNAVPGIQKQDDSWRQVGCSSCIFLSITNRIQILLDECRKTNLLEHIYYQYCRDAASDSQNGCIQRQVGRQHWELLMRFLLCTRTFIYFVMLISLASIDPWPSSDALWGRLCVCVCVKVQRIQNSGVISKSLYKTWVQKKCR